MVTITELSTGTKAGGETQSQESFIIASKSYATVREISALGTKAEQRLGHPLSVSQFGQLFGLEIKDGGTKVSSRLSNIQLPGGKGEIPVLYLHFGRTKAADAKALLNGLTDALSVKVYKADKEFSQEDLAKIRSTPRQIPRPVLGSGKDVVRAKDLRFLQKFGELKPAMAPDKAGTLSRIIQEEGPERLENAVIMNLSMALMENGTKAAHYQAEIIGAMETNMLSAGRYGNVAAAIYACDDLYTDALDKVYGELTQQELGEEMEL